MILNPSAGLVHLHFTVARAESVVIVPNFNKGLTQVRSPIGPSAPPVVTRKQIRTPKLELLPAKATPRKALLLSTLLHTAIGATAAALPILFPSWLPEVPSTSGDFDREFQVVYQSLQLPALPGMAEVSERVKAERGSGHKTHDIANLLPIAALHTANGLKRDYAAAQEIVSNPPDSIKGVQTIRRPDIASPQKMAYPLRLPGIVMLPHRAAQAPVTPQLEHPEPLNSETPLAFSAGEPPAPPDDKPKLSLGLVKPVLRKTSGVTEARAPLLAATIEPQVDAQEAAVIINAVGVPPEPGPVIPDAELASRFVIGPSREATTAAATTPEATSGNPASASPSKTGPNLPHASAEIGIGTKAEASEGHTVVANIESSSGAGTQPVSRSSTATTAATEKKSFPEISISGSMPGSSGRARATSPVPHGSYALTIISGGSSGGASRDLGVFSRSDTVYTVYIPMTDAGGGPDWSMQYALIGPAPARDGLPNGLLTPPVVLQKIQATALKTELGANSGRVFVTGIIDENGKLGALRAIRALDGRARSALNALAQWQFLAAQLNGKQVACKVLIGVSVLPAEGVGK